MRRLQLRSDADIVAHRGARLAISAGIRLQAKKSAWQVDILCVHGCSRGFEGCFVCLPDIPFDERIALKAALGGDYEIFRISCDIASVKRTDICWLY